MRLKRLDLLGFKSFAERAEFGFGPGLTGLVGPNGCGKSNVIDAVRWVLGEQRPGALRGEEMADVLFKGTEGRPPLGLAEVCVVFEDEGGRLPEGRSEASVTRRLFRTGESEYLLNGRAVRLKDVRDFLFDTGLGVRGYSAMEQGRIDALLSVDPQERRSVFEEAAGISRFRARRREALRKIEQVELDLTRLADLLGELETRVRSLKIQAGKARRYEEQVKALREMRLALALHARARSEEDLRAARSALSDLEARAEACRALRAEAEGEARTRETEAQDASAQSARLAEEIAGLREEEKVGLERSAAARARGEDAQRAAAAGSKGLEETERRALALSEEEGSLASEASGGAFRRQAAEAALAACEERLREVHRRFREAERACAASSERLLGAMHERAAARNRLTQAEADRRACEALLTRALSHEEELAATLGAAEREGRELEGAVAGAAGKREGLAADREGAAARVKELEASLLALEEAVRSAESQRAAHVARLETLRALEEAKEGVEEGARALLAAGLPEIPGLLADRLAVEPSLAPALEAVLGPHVHALLVERTEGAAAALKWLRDRGQGRATLAVSEWAERPPVPPQLREEGVEGRLLERVRPQAPVSRLLETLLGDVFLVRSSDDALRLAARHPHLRFVTRAGDVAGRGFVSGGGPKGGDLLVRRAAREELEATLRTSDADLEARRRAEREAGEALAAERDSLEHLSGLATEADREVVGLEARQEVGERRREEIGRERAAVAEEVRALREEAAGLGRSLEEAARESTRCESAIVALEEASRTAEAERRERDREREEATSAENDARVALAREVEQSRALAGRLEAARAALAGAREDSDRIRGEIEEARAREGASLAEAADLERRAEAARSGRADLEAKGALLATREAEAREHAKEARARAERRTEELEEVASGLGEARLREQKLSLERGESARRILDDYGVDLEASAREFVPDPAFDAPRVESEIGEARAKIERFGPVNLEAVRELEEAEARHGELSAQKADLEAARTSLREGVRRLDVESRERFEETFKAVQENFSTVFRQLFRGGKAEVSLEEGVDLLEAGISIVARPPGKELRSIELLSGGERTLTAIALLFALFRAKPSPFCLLDEVDAALDDANVERFLGLLREYTADTQFLLVTHNRRSMADCATLFGVTMEENGVSKVVAVELEEAERFAEEPAPAAELVPAPRAEESAAKGAGTPAS
ncbi:MAG: chromosome segregation protein SMC [Planctomycetes bacterium]|nr:chromosome segregation protein SMC [Planctomycetota bacterium]